jgi:hypothetical protein
MAKALINFNLENANLRKAYLNNDQLGYYLAGLLEGDGHISLPAVGNTTLKRILNPRMIFTSHINNLGLYAYIQSELGGIGRFQITLPLKATYAARGLGPGLSQGQGWD